MSEPLDARRAQQALRESEIRLRAMTDSAHDAILMMDPEGRVSYWNRAAEHMFGLTSTEAVGQYLHTLIVPSVYLAAFHAAFPAFLQTGRGPAIGTTRDLVGRRADGQEFPIQLSLSAVQLDGRWHAVGLVRDTTESKRTEEELTRAHARLEALMDNTPDHIYFKDADSRFAMISTAMARSFGLGDPSQALGKTDFDFFTEDQARLSLEGEREIMRSGRPLVDFEERETWPDGRETWASTTKLPRTDTEGNVVGTFGISRDITARKQAEGELEETNRRLAAAVRRSTEMTLRAEHEAMHDPLTGALNRRAFTDVLSREISGERRYQHGLALGICDVDQFKKVNDTLGHQVGDEVLCGLVRLIESTLREHDVLGRHGGDEFVVLTDHAGEADAVIPYERARAVVAGSPIATRAGNISITISFGVAIWRAGDTEDDLLVAADRALYQAKDGGRNRVRLAGDGVSPDGGPASPGTGGREASA